MKAKEFPKKDENLYSRRPEDAIYRLLSIIVEFFDTENYRNYKLVDTNNWVLPWEINSCFFL